MTTDFRTLAIVGCGLIGGSIALAARERYPELAVATLDKGDDLSPVAAADLVVLAAPIEEMLRLLPLLRPHLRVDAIVTDTGSTKRAIVAAAAGMRFIGGHPVAGAAAGGRAAARADLFVGRRWILTPVEATLEEDLARLRRFVEGLGAAADTLDAVEHDRLFAFVSHLPQLAVSALMDVAGSEAGERGLALAGTGLRDSTRLASSPPAIWRDIVRTNRANVDRAIGALIERLERLRDDPEGDELATLFESAARWRQTLEKRSL